jgi:hypothetical protein
LKARNYSNNRELSLTSNVTLFYQKAVHMYNVLVTVTSLMKDKFNYVLFYLPSGPVGLRRYKEIPAEARGGHEQLSQY